MNNRGRFHQFKADIEHSSTVELIYMINEWSPIHDPEVHQDKVLLFNVF